MGGFALPLVTFFFPLYTDKEDQVKFSFLFFLVCDVLWLPVGSSFESSSYFLPVLFVRLFPRLCVVSFSSQPNISPLYNVSSVLPFLQVALQQRAGIVYISTTFSLSSSFSSLFFFPIFFFRTLYLLA